MSSSTDDDEINLESANFNPLKALYSQKLKLPAVQQNFENLGIFEARLKVAGNEPDADLASFKHHKSKKTDAGTSKQRDSEPINDDKFHTTTSGRVFDKSQAPIKGYVKTKFKRNVLTRMETAKGPLALLMKFVTNQTRVRVYIRKEHDIKGHVTGIIELFDKHLNLALSDCIESYQRRKYDYMENKTIIGVPEDCSDLIARMGFKGSMPVAKSIDRKHVQCIRNFKRLCIRGEHVVLISEDFLK